MKFPLFFNIFLIAAVPLFAAVPVSGGDATIYEAYRENLDKDREQAVHYAEMYLGSLEDGIADSVSAEMASFLADWWGNEKFLFSKAIRWEEGLLDYYIREDNPCRIAETESRLAGLYYKTGYYHKTLRYANSARYHFERCEDTVGLLNVYNLLGQVYFVCNDYRTAEKYFISFEQGARARNDSVMLVRAINNMSLLPRKRNDFEKARLLIGKSIELSKSIGDSSLFFRGYLNLTASYIDNPDTLGLKMMTDSLGRFSGYASTHEDKGLYYYTIGASELRQGNYDRAALFMESAIKEYSAGEFFLQLRSCWNILHTIYRHLGDMPKAYHALEEFVSVCEALEHNNVFLQLFEFQDSLILHNQRETLIKKENAQRITWITMIFSVLVAALLLVLYFWRRSVKMHRREEELNNRHKLLELRKIQQYRLDRLSEEVLSDLDKLKKEVDDDSVRGSINKICHDLQNTMKNEGDNFDASAFIPDFNNDFYARLLKDFPNLTLNERRLCAFLKMNMTTKDIAEITRQSISGINKARTRLRNKLGITGDGVSIQEFLSKYD